MDNNSFKSIKLTEVRGRLLREVDQTYVDNQNSNSILKQKTHVGLTYLEYTTDGDPLAQRYGIVPIYSVNKIKDIPFNSDEEIKESTKDIDFSLKDKLHAVILRAFIMYLETEEKSQAIMSLLLHSIELLYYANLSRMYILLKIIKYAKENNSLYLILEQYDEIFTKTKKEISIDQLIYTTYVHKALMVIQNDLKAMRKEYIKAEQVMPLIAIISYRFSKNLMDTNESVEKAFNELVADLPQKESLQIHEYEYYNSIKLIDELLQQRTTAKEHNKA